MSGTSETELRALLRDFDVGAEFIGIYDNSFAGFARAARATCCIVNTGSRESGGVHWIACAYNPKARVITVFDPLGWSDRALLRLYRFSLKPMLRRTLTQSGAKCLRFVRNREAVQCACSGSCGLFCVAFIAAVKAMPSAPLKHSIIQNFDGAEPAFPQTNWPPLHRNQSKMYDLLRSRSMYFRNNEAILMRNTALNLINAH